MFLRSVLYGLLWASFGLLHSVMAAPTSRRRVLRVIGTGERLAYNVTAALHLGAVLWFGSRLLGPAPGFALPRPLRRAMQGAVAVGAVLMLAAGRSYDLGRFLGIRQIRDGITDETTAPPEALVTSGMRGHVRHPLYAGGLLFAWGLATTPFLLVTAACASGYVAIGMRYEERKLMRLYGSAYAAYRRRVPALVPRLPR